jgi:phosphodiesterase/alkaline phosphatase D-like protein
MSYDRWEGYGDARRELFDHINDERIDNVWFLSGDLHVNFVSRLEPSGSDRASRAREIAVTGGNTALGVRGRQFSYSRTAPRACLLTFDPFADEVRVEFRSPDGRIDYASQLRHD